MSGIPALRTERLTLREHRADDLPACAAMWADARVVRHIGGKPFDESQVWQRMTSYRGHWVLEGFGYWALEDKDTGRFIGELGFADFRRDIVPSLRGIPELGWALAPDFHGRGLATEGLTAALAWADLNLAAPKTACIVDPGNAASLRVAAKIGFVERCRTTFKGGPTIMLERERRKP